MSQPLLLVLMGVSGAGKTTIGQLLAERTGAPFADGDDFHPPANKQKMAAGIPLTDEDRLPWLATLNDLLRGWAQGGSSGVLACSALKESYRALLSANIPPGLLHFVLLTLTRTELQERLAQRHHEYMNPALLDSQLQTLEPPRDAYTVVNDRPPDTVVGEILHLVSGGPA